MSRRHRQPDITQQLATLSTQVADLARRITPEQAARGTKLPVAMVRNPQLFLASGAHAPVPGKTTPGLGIPDPGVAEQYNVNQAPQQTPSTIFAPGAPLRPMQGFETPEGPRQWADFPVGYNIAALPRSSEATSFWQLRQLAALSHAIQLAESVWFDVLMRLEPRVTMRAGVIPDGESDTDAKWQKILAPAAAWLERPDGQTRLSAWLCASVRDVLELGVSTIWKRRNRKGEILGLDYVDAASIKLLINQRGRLPEPPDYAFLQFVHGIPAGWYKSDNMVMLQEAARTDSIYPMSRVEKVLLLIQQHLRLQTLNLSRFTDGATPEGILFPDASVTNTTPEDWEQYERMLNGLIAGNDQQKVRLHIAPPGITSFQQTRPYDAQIDYDRWLLNVIAAEFGVTLSELGITESVNKSSGDSQENVVYRRVVRPVAKLYSDLLTDSVREKFADERICVEWGGIAEPEDEYQKAQTLQIGVQTGAISPSDMAHLMGWPVAQEIKPFVMFDGGPSAVIQLDTIDASLKQAQQVQAVDLATKQAQGKIADLQAKSLQKQLDKPDEPDYGSFDFGDEGDQGGQGGGDTGSPSNAGGESSASSAAPSDSGGGGSSPSTAGEGQGAAQSGDASQTAGLAPTDAQVSALIDQAKQTLASSGKAKRAQMTDGDVSDEWRRYRAVALNALKQGRLVPRFESDVLPAPLHAYAEQHLARCSSPDEVRAVFAQIRDAESHEADCRCMICGCGRPFDDHSMPYPVANTAGNSPGDPPVPDAGSGLQDVTVCFYPPGHILQPLCDLVPNAPQEGSWPDYHVTLAYLGKQADLDVEQLCLTVAAWAKHMPPVILKINGYARFKGVDEGNDAVVALVDAPDLVAWRTDLMAALAGAGFVVAANHGFTPHITLATLDSAAPMPEWPLVHAPLDGAPFTCEQVWVWAGLRRYAFPLGGGALPTAQTEPESAVIVLDELRALKAEVARAMEDEQRPPFG